VTEWNEAAATVCGVPRARAIGKVVTDLEPARMDFDMNRARIERVLAGEVMIAEGITFRRPGEGEPTHIEASIAPLRDAASRVVGGVAVVVDVTERVRVEAERDRLIADLDAARDRAERASQAKSAMLAGLSHELRTPLGAVLGFAQLLRDGRAGPLTPEQTEYVDDVLTGAGYLLRVVNDALDLARVEAGAVEMRPEPIDLHALVAQALATVAPLASAHGITITSRVAPEGTRLTADPGRVRQVLLNYLSNAVKYSRAGDEVVVEAAPEGDAEVRLTVRDNGPGIPPSEMGRLFVEFQRLSSDRDVPGSGLGLAITKRLVEAMGGSVSAESSPGGGSAFHAVLPVRPSP
jgi:PAS domain S-box-containing protein